MIDAVVYTSVHLEDVISGFDAMTRGNVLAKTFREMKTPLRLDQAAHAAQHTGPDSTWPGKHPATLARHGHKPRKLMGKLPTAVSYTASAEGVVATSRVAWSGGAISEGGKVGHGAILPKREFLWISDEMMQLAEDVTTGRLIDAYGGAP